MIDVLKSYRKIVAKQTMEKIVAKAERISDKHILCINSTFQGGGVAEILDSAVLLFNGIGVNFGWRILHGNPDFFTVTKKIHNALQGEDINFSDRKKKLYYETNRRFSKFTHIDHDLVIIHDTQPLPLIDFYEKSQPWIFRSHVDLSTPNPEVWGYIKRFIKKYDHFVVSYKKFLKKDLKLPQNIIPPAIDPISQKNKEIPWKVVYKYLGKYGIIDDKPIFSQISRFDKWKDPLGVVNVFERVRRKTDCQLVLLGSFASDDPEGQILFEKVDKKAKKSKYGDDIKLLFLENDFLVNCLQRASAVVIQKSIKEGFGLTISEALYKGTPVVASKVGGIPSQVINGVNGFLLGPEDNEGFARYVTKIIEDNKLRNKLGKNGREHIKKNFLITRLVSDWLDLLQKYLL